MREINLTNITRMKKVVFGVAVVAEVFGVQNSICSFISKINYHEHYDWKSSFLLL